MRHDGWRGYQHVSCCKFADCGFILIAKRSCVGCCHADKKWSIGIPRFNSFAPGFGLILYRMNAIKANWKGNKAMVGIVVIFLYVLAWRFGFVHLLYSLYIGLKKQYSLQLKAS